MENLLREMTDEEVKVSLLNGGSACSNYKAVLPGLIAGCAASITFGGTSNCSAMQTISRYIKTHC